MKTIISILLVSVGALATGIPGHQDYNYTCTIMSDDMGSASMMSTMHLHRHVGCFGESMTMSMMDDNGMTAPMQCMRRYDLPSRTGTFYTCGEDVLFLDLMNGESTWTMGDMTMRMDCVMDMRR